MAPMSVYVGGLSEDTQKEDLEREFGRFGYITKVWIARNPPGFAFVDFENYVDAEEAIRELNGGMINGCEISVEESRGGRKGGRGRGGRGVGFRGGRGGRGGYGGQDRSFDSSYRRGGGGRRYGGGDYDGGSGYRSRSPIGQRNDRW